MIWVSLDPEEPFRAQMTAIQLAALRARLASQRVITELKSLPYLSSFKASQSADAASVSRLLKNGWNTEFLLRSNSKALQGDALRNSLHWAFPQAYYAVFSVATAFFKVAGFTEVSHTAVIRKIGSLMKQGKYPPTVSFLADGGKDRRYYNIQRVDMPSTTYFDEDDPPVCDTQICQFLNATRDIDLKDKQHDLRFRTKQGRPKRALTKDDWERVSKKVGLTSIMSLLYRKRIKSNYRDIDTYLSPHLDPVAAYSDLVQVVGCLNFVHECFIHRGLGAAFFDSAVHSVRQRGYAFLTKRAQRIRVANEGLDV